MSENNRDMFDNERWEMYRLRCAITQQINYHRTRHGNKDGRARPMALIVAMRIR
jgi:hypothetical protein